ncbi:hypothetical protein BLS_008514 [Venturia inaequalis]|uniref:Uncharacterized protein n=1 Tax=Venturia inaequalis TaxID=5025 RepID=A0A8H3YPT1_VENIN|nr:hypothetical protein BLS_008514 [Venturia inaequalis]KAE9968905.1 hypothetical protein EG328_007171 [Venturia inaequalis]
MGNITDPMFWRRFSMAAHQDDEEKASKAAGSPDGQPGLQPSHSWLDRQKKKKSQRTTVCWIFWIAVAFLVGSIIVAFLLLRHNGIIGSKGAPPISGDEEIYAVHGSGP